MKLLLTFALTALSFSLATSANAGPIFGGDDDVTAEQGPDADERRADREAWRPGFGARIGGYGFRNPDGDAGWDTCRMNGFGIFGTLDLNRYVYSELSLDFYQATPGTVSQGLDRTSSHLLAGLGLRMLPDFVVTPFVVLGGGAEHTRVDLPRDVIEAVYPMGYIGLGGEINVTHELKLGATVRMLATTRPEFASIDAGGGLYGSGSEASLTGGGSTNAAMQFDVASQAQFFVRYAL